LYISLDPEIEIIKFRNIKLLEVFSQVGGIIKFLSYFTIFIKYLYKNTAINKLVYELKEYDDLINENSNKNTDTISSEDLVINDISYNNYNNSIGLIDDDINPDRQKLNKLIDGKSDVTKINKKSKCFCYCCRKGGKDSKSRDKDTISKTTYNTYRNELKELMNISNVLKYFMYVRRLINVSKKEDKEGNRSNDFDKGNKDDYNDFNINRDNNHNRPKDNNNN